MEIKDIIQQVKQKEITHYTPTIRTYYGDKKYEVFVVAPQDKDMFPYILMIPEDCKNGEVLAIESNNLETNNFDQLLENAGRTTLSSAKALSRFNAPMLVPILPSEKHEPYYQQLARECFTEKKEGEQKVENFDAKLMNTINNAYIVAKNELDLEFDPQLYVHGYSSSGCFAQRFALIHPEMVKGLCVGGGVGSIPMPTVEFSYPLGIKDFKELFGKPFNMEAYKRIPQTYYVGELEDARKSESRFDEDNKPAPMHDMSYFDRSLPLEEGLKLRKAYGKDMIARAKNQIEELQKLGIDISLDVIQGRSHNDLSGHGVNEYISKYFQQGYDQICNYGHSYNATKGEIYMKNNEFIGKTNEQLNFVKFLSDKGLMDYFTSETTATRHNKGQYQNHLPLPIEEKKEIVSYFYGKTFGVLEGINVFAMMHGLRKKYDVQVIAGNGDSVAGVNRDKTLIDAKIYTEPTIQGFETIAHEIGHVLTGRNNRHVVLLKKINNAKNQQERELAEREYEGYCREKASCKCDCIGEIETMTIEKLFLLFLSEDEKCRKLLDQYGFDIDQYMVEYEKEHENMAYQRIQTAVQTKQILEKYNITTYFRDEKEFEAFLSSLPSDSAREEFKRDMEQILSEDAKYSFRYVAGEAISKHWFDKFKTADKKERKELRDKFTEFWHGTDKLDIEQASALLCEGKTLDEVIARYCEQTQIHESDLSSTPIS